MDAKLPELTGPAAVTDEDVLPILLRCRDGHQWSWNLSKRLINMYYGTQYTEKELKALYKKGKRP